MKMQVHLPHVARHQRLECLQIVTVDDQVVTKGEINKMADREGFEPSVTLLLHTLSKRAHSTTLTPALGGREARKSIRAWQSLFEIPF